jgi:hypothetical protein
MAQWVPYTDHEDSTQDDEPLQERACRECGSVFTITVAEGDWYAAKAMVLPKRCLACRGGKCSLSHACYGGAIPANG